ncbi:MAG: zinc-ribbon and DUF3426 domain-containing protein [Gammaproteobacteria bacterium]|nr:zinc-ribbon and DUF3426 domain-containing protein [Gammaproteobacteria bacterium]
MFTVCPKCALSLVVTAADLRVAQGYVRCGRCSSVFNALARLSEERHGPTTPDPMPSGDPPPEPPPPPATEPPPEPAPPAQPEEPPAPVRTESESLEFNADTDVDSVFVQAQPDPQWTAATGSFRALLAASQEGSPAPAPAADSARPEEESPVEVELDSNFFAAMLGSATAAAAAAAPAPPEPAAPAEAPPPSGSAPPEPTRSEGGEGTAPVTRLPRSPRAPAAPAPPEPVPEEWEAEESSAEPAVPQPQRLWLAGSVLGGLVLCAQIVNFHRDTLATRPAWSRPLQSLYGALGVRLYPQWDLRAYDVRQLGADAGSAAGLITVRASVKNDATQAQPLPLLRVTLQDRFGNRIASRDVAPRSYLPRAVPPEAYLSAGQRIDAEIGFADPGTDAVGFEIDACLPVRGGGIACANDAALR